jgi:hypothetical protein
MELVFYALIWGPAVLIAASAFFFYAGLRDSRSIAWTRIAIGISMLLLACGWLIAVMISDISLIAFYEFLFASGASVLAGVSLVLLLVRWRKVIGLLMSIGFPVALYLGLEIGSPYTPDSIIRKNGEAIAQAVTEYHSDRGIYPDTLNELIPAYLTDLREPKTIWGWLYLTSRDDYTLGYVSYINKWGYSICKYSATAPEWDCPLNYSTAPLVLEPTPGP